jgi:hypothetical protein
LSPVRGEVKLVTDPKGFPDHIGLGPASIVDDHARAVLRGEA